MTASQGLMLESISERLMETVHAGSPTKHPERRIETIAAAGELRVPFTSGILVGIGETEDERVAALEKLAELHAEHGHIQEVILQNFVPHQSYYGREPAMIAGDAAAEYWRTGVWSGPELEAPDWSCEVSVADMRRLVEHARRLLPGVGIQVPPNLSDWWVDLVEQARATSAACGPTATTSHPSTRSRPRPGPPPPPGGWDRAVGAPLRLSGVHRPRVVVRGRARRDQEPLLVVHPASRLRAPRLAVSIGDAVAPRAVARAREGATLSADEMTALFSEQRPEVIEEMRAAADELRSELAGDTVTFVVNRNINVSNICVVGCAFCGFGQSKRSPDAYEHSEQEFADRVGEALEFGATEICMQSGIHPDWQLEDYERWLRLAKRLAPEVHLHAYSPMEVSHMCDVSGLSPRAVFERLREAGLGSTPGTAAEVLDDGVRERISPNKLPVARWVEIIEASHAEGIRSTSTVMFGHIEEPWELAEHMRVVRELQERTGGITEFVPLSFIPFHTLLGRTHGIEEITREENLKHTAAFRLALGRTVPNLQASWVKMGLDAATESLRWGVNDLGGTLMEESISRMAGSYHGVRLEPSDLVAAAHRAGRPAAERTTLYEIRRRYEVPVAA